MSLIPHAVPLIQVSHLPSASSYYASLTQPLNIRYLTATTTYPATLHFGRITPTGTETLFSLTQSLTPTPFLTRIYLPASSPKQVQDFYAKSCALNPACRQSGLVNLNGTVEGDGTKAVTRDLDGHMIEAIYSTRGGGSTASTEKEARRVLEWQKEVAESVGAGGGSQVGTEAVSRRDLGHGRRADSLPMRLVRRETVTEHWAPAGHQEQQTGNGISGKAIIGTILGAAAGAAVAYAMVRSEGPSRPAPEDTRRASYSHPPPAIDMIPARSHVSARDRQQEGVLEGPRYPRYAIAPAPSPPPTLMRAGTWTSGEVKQIDQRSYVSGRSAASHKSSRTRSRSEHPSATSDRFDRALPIVAASSHHDHDGGDTHVSKRSHGSRARSHVSHSRASRRDDVIEVFEDDAPTEEDDRKSSSRSKHSSHSKHSKHSHHHRSHSRNPHVETASPSEASNSYTSARSHASSSTIKPHKSTSRRSSSRAPDSGPGATITISGRDGVRVIDNRGNTSRSHVSPREIPLPRSTISVARDVPLPRSTVSVARDVPLPMSVISGASGREYGYMNGGGGGGGMGYAASVAPSDSVSCIGSKRERERLRGRMGREVSW